MTMTSIQRNVEQLAENSFHVITLTAFQLFLILTLLWNSITIKLGCNELGRNERGYNELGCNERGYNELGCNEVSYSNGL